MERKHKRCLHNVQIAKYWKTMKLQPVARVLNLEKMLESDETFSAAFGVIKVK